MKESISNKYFYNVTLSTMVGLRHGHLFLETNQNKISGYMDLFNHKNNFYGKLLDTGWCELMGTLTTLMAEHLFTAIGKYDCSSIELKLKIKEQDYKLYGTATKGV